MSSPSPSSRFLSFAVQARFSFFLTLCSPTLSLPFTLPASLHVSHNSHNSQKHHLNGNRNNRLKQTHTDGWTNSTHSKGTQVHLGLSHNSQEQTEEMTCNKHGMSLQPCCAARLWLTRLRDLLLPPTSIGDCRLPAGPVFTYRPQAGRRRQYQYVTPRRFSIFAGRESIGHK